MSGVGARGGAEMWPRGPDCRYSVDDEIAHEEHIRRMEREYERHLAREYERYIASLRAPTDPEDADG